MSHAKKRYTTRRAFLHTAGAALGTAALGGLLPRGARAQDGIVWYTGLSVKASDDLLKTWSQKTGIEGKYFRAGGLKVAQKYEQEVKANQVAASVVSTAIPSLIAKWAKDGLILPYDCPEFAAYPESTVIKGFAGPLTADAQSPAYNTELVPQADAPKHWEDLLDPKWKGKMTMVDATASGGALHWYSALRKEFGLDYMKKLSKQDILVRTGGGNTINALVSGERSVAIVLAQYHALRPMSKGAPLRLITPDEGVPINYNQIFVPAAAPNPDDGKKFVDYALSREAQMFLGKKYFTGSFRKDMPPTAGDTGARPLSEVRAIRSSPADMQEFFDKQVELSQEYASLFK